MVKPKMYQFAEPCALVPPCQAAFLTACLAGLTPRNFAGRWVASWHQLCSASSGAIFGVALLLVSGPEAR